MIKELIKDLVYDNITLSQALTRAKLIAYKIDNNDYRLWIENELNGYSDHNALPQYRKIPCELKAVISNPFYGTYEIPFVIDSPIFYNIDVTQSISQLEENLSAANGKLSGYQKLPQNLVQELRKTTDEGQQLT